MNTSIDGQLNETGKVLTNSSESIDEAISTLSRAGDAAQTHLLQMDSVGEVPNIKIPISSYAMTSHLSEMSQDDYDSKAAYENKSDKTMKLLKSRGEDVASQKAGRDQSWEQLEGDMVQYFCIF